MVDQNVCSSATGGGRRLRTKSKRVTFVDGVDRLAVVNTSCLLDHGGHVAFLALLTRASSQSVCDSNEHCAIVNECRFVQCNELYQVVQFMGVDCKDWHRSWCVV